MTHRGAARTSSRKDWCTPPKLVTAVRSVFDGTVDLDPCSNEHSTVGARVGYVLPDRDGLVEPWNVGTVFVNPPYGADRERGTTILDWFRKASNTAQDGFDVIVLAPVATNTTHWKRFVFPEASAVCFLADTRLRFHLDGVEDRKGAPMACATILWGSRVGAFTSAFTPHGHVVHLR